LISGFRRFKRFNRVQWVLFSRFGGAGVQRVIVNRANLPNLMDPENRLNEKYERTKDVVRTQNEGPSTKDGPSSYASRLEAAI
jgi:hypothetical protein